MAATSTPISVPASFVAFAGSTGHEHWDWRAALVKASGLEPAQISSFGVDGDGEVYIVSLLGDIYELAPQ